MNLVLLSPEIALSERFKTKVLYDQAFRDHLVLVAIDELHVVSEWGQRWRSSYSQLALLRDVIDRRVPWLGCSATLDPVTLPEVRDLCGFDSSVRIQRTSIDRPDIMFTIRTMQHPINSFRDLEFLVKPVYAAVEQVVTERRENMAREVLKGGGGKVAAQAVLRSTQHQRKDAGSDSRACCMRIPKTIVYVDSIKQIAKVVRALTTMLIQAGCSKTSTINAVQAYHSELAEFDKRLISTEFAKPDIENFLDSSMHRIIVATDAMGMGINNPDVRLVVQLGIPPSMGALMQRAGRAARGEAIYGKFIWLVPPWCFGDRTEQLLPRSIKKRPTEQERRSILPRGIWELINSSTCIRRGILEFFGEDCASYSCPVEAVSCCSKCAGDEVGIRIRRAGRLVRTVQSQKHITDAVKLALVEWREAKAVTVLFQTVFIAAPAELILPDKAVGLISRTAATVNSISSLAHAVNREWGDLASYGKEVLEVTQNACLQATFKKQNYKIRVEEVELAEARRCTSYVAS
jgi:superfamily II DNA helicase RecQ